MSPLGLQMVMLQLLTLRHQASRLKQGLQQLPRNPARQEAEYFTALAHNVAEILIPGAICAAVNQN